MEFPKRTMTSGRRIFFFPSPSPPPSSRHPLGRNFYLSPTFLCFKNPIREDLLSVSSLAKNTPALQATIMVIIIVFRRQDKEAILQKMDHNFSKLLLPGRSSLQIIFVSKQVICLASDKFSPDMKPF